MYALVIQCHCVMNRKKNKVVKEDPPIIVHGGEEAAEPGACKSWYTAGFLFQAYGLDAASSPPHPICWI